MRSQLRVAVLECDEPIGQTKKKYDNFNTLFRDLLEVGTCTLAAGSTQERPNLEISGWDVVTKQEYPDVACIDAVLLSGSRYDSFASGDNDWITRLVEYIRILLQEQRRVRVLGVCFGHQIIGRALGVMPQRNEKGWEVSVTSIKLTVIGQQLFGPETLAVHQMHRDILPTCPPEADLLGYSPHCSVQGLYVKNRLISVQGHPEFNENIMNELLSLRRGTVLDEEMYQIGKARAHHAHDGVKVAAAFAKFLLED